MPARTTGTRRRTAGRSRSNSRTRRDGAPDRAAYSWATALDRFAYVRRILGDRDVELNTLIFGMTVAADRPAAIADLAKRMEGAPAEMIDRSPFFLVGSL